MTWQTQLATILLPAILQVESGGRLDVPDSAAGARGPYQITLAAWTEALEYLWKTDSVTFPYWGGGDWIDGPRNLLCARVAARAYLLSMGERYQKRTGRAPTMEVLARMYNGGPSGWKHLNTVAYWRRVQTAIASQRVAQRDALSPSNGPPSAAVPRKKSQARAPAPHRQP